MNLRAQNIFKYYSRPVVNDVSVNLNQGEIVGLLGPNGAGKTTTFYMMVGLVSPFKGEVFLDQTDITKLPMYKRAQMARATYLKKHLFLELCLLRIIFYQF